jgi:hypothetical protein
LARELAEATPGRSLAVELANFAAGRVRPVSANIDHVPVMVTGALPRAGMRPTAVMDHVRRAVWMRDLRYPAPRYTGDSITSYVPLGYYKLAWFMTDAFGYGDFQVKLVSDVLTDGTLRHPDRPERRPWANPGYIRSTVIATQKYLTVSVHS